MSNQKKNSKQRSIQQKALVNRVRKEGSSALGFWALFFISCHKNYLIEQVMSSPQHIGDLILPCPFGHFETWTSVPFSSFILSLTRGASHFAQVALTAIPHFAHS
jgi:hypothetical protein